MKHCLALIFLTLTTPAFANQPDVSITDDGKAVYYHGDGSPTPLIGPKKVGQATLAPDDRTVAMIEVLVEGTPAYDDSRTQLWIGDGITGKSRILFRPRPGTDPKTMMAAIWNPHFSLGGGFVYVEAEAWVTSAAIHQINVKTGAEKFVIDGSIMGVMRTGPHRGSLLVRRHLYPKNPEDGASDEVHLVRPDGKMILIVPGSRGDEGEGSVAAWLKAKGWAAH
jgi:hypothetical protein